MGSFLKVLARDGHRIDKEAVARSPHLHRRLAFFAIAIVLLSSIVGTRFLQLSHANAEMRLSLTGAHLMTASEMITARNDSSSDVTPYWFGAMSNFAYTCSTIENSEYVVTYVRGSVHSPESTPATYTIDAYASDEAFHSDPQGQDFSVDSNVTTPNGRGVIYNFGTMKLAEVKIPGTTEVVLVRFATPQTLAQMMDLADSLTPLA